VEEFYFDDEDEMFGGPDMCQWNVAVHVGAKL
jgi:hypothetical protein